MLIDRVRIVGRGRAGGSLAAALERSGRVGVVELVEGRPARTPLMLSGSEDDGAQRDLGRGCDFVVLAVPDQAIAAVSRSITPTDAMVVHLSGALGVENTLASHLRRGGLHPLVSLPDAQIGADRLMGSWCGLGGGSDVERLARALHAQTFVLRDEDRARYHAAAVWSSNVVVGVMAEVLQLAESVDVPLEAFIELARGSLDNVSAVGPGAALTGPVVRGDWDTIRHHLRVLDSDQRDSYLGGVRIVARLADVGLPPDIAI